MKEQLTAEQIETYRTQGFLAIENFFGPDELKAWQTSTEEAVAKRLGQLEVGMQSGDVKPSMMSRLKKPIVGLLGKKGAEKAKGLLRAVLGAKRVPIGFSGVLNTNQGDKDSYYAQVYVQCIRLAFEHEGMKKCVLDPRIGKIASELAGVDGMRLYHDQALYKPAFGNPTAWHLDNPFWSFFSKQSMTMWVALEDATLKNGCMYYIPGSHLTATNKNLSIGENFAGLFKLYPDWKKVEPVGCPCPAGSVVFHSGMTAHGAGVNMSSRPRKAYACAFMPIGSTFNGQKDVLSGDYFKTLKVGDVLDNDEINPVIWQRGKTDSGPSFVTSKTAEPALAGAV